MRRLAGLGILSGLLVGGGVAAAGPSATTTAEETAIQSPAVERGWLNLGIRDEAAMVLVGTILIGLAGAVRRAA
jgi:hypothetical protein